MCGKKLILILFVSNLIRSSEVNNIPFLSKLLKYVFFHNNCVYYMPNDSDIDLTLSISLTFANIQIIKTDLSSLNQINYFYHCSGYLLTERGYNDSGLILKNLGNHKTILPYERIIIFSSIESNVDVQLLANITSRYAVDVVTVTIKSDIKNRFYLRTQSLEVMYKNELVAKWNHVTEFLNLEKLEETKWTPKANSKSPFIMSVFNCPPFFYITEENQIVGGVEYKILHEIFRPWSHTYKILNKNESRNEFDKWGLILDKVIKKSSDLAACSQWQVSMNLSLVDTTYPLQQICVTFLVPKPHLLPYFTFVLQPFSVSVWILTIVVFFVFTASMLHTLRMYKVFKTNHFGNLEQDKVIVFFYLVRLWALGGINVTPRPTYYTLRFLFLIWLMFCLIYSTYYSAGVTSSLTNPRFTNTIKTLEDMVNYKIKWLEDAFLKDSFKSSGIKLFEKLADLSVPEKNKNVAVIVKQLSNMYLTEIEYLDDYDRKHLTVLKECFGNFYLVFAMKKRSPYTKIINKYLARFQEFGLLQFWLRNATYFDNSRHHFNSLHSLQTDGYVNQYNIDIRRFIGAFYLVALGQFVAFLIFLCEYFHIVTRLWDLYQKLINHISR